MSMERPARAPRSPRQNAGDTAQAPPTPRERTDCEILAGAVQFILRHVRKRKPEENPKLYVFDERKLRQANSLDNDVLQASCQAAKLASFVTRALEKTSGSIPVLVIAVYYLSKVLSKLPLYPPTWRPVTLCALMAADKMQLDPSRPGGCYAYRHNERYGDLLPSLTAPELLKMELGFATAAEWRFNVSPEQYERFVGLLLQESICSDVQRACD